MNMKYDVDDDDEVRRRCRNTRLEIESIEGTSVTIIMETPHHHPSYHRHHSPHHHYGKPDIIVLIIVPMIMESHQKMRVCVLGIFGFVV